MDSRPVKNKCPLTLPKTCSIRALLDELDVGHRNHLGRGNILHHQAKALGLAGRGGVPAQHAPRAPFGVGAHADGTLQPSAGGVVGAVGIVGAVAHSPGALILNPWGDQASYNGPAGAKEARRDKR